VFLVAFLKQSHLSNLENYWHKSQFQSSIGIERQWVRVGSDGIPYRIADGLIMNFWKCKECDKESDVRIVSKENHIVKTQWISCII
jgi:hypothetical protein